MGSDKVSEGMGGRPGPVQFAAGIGAPGPGGPPVRKGGTRVSPIADADGERGVKAAKRSKEWVVAERLFGPGNTSLVWRRLPPPNVQSRVHKLDTAGRRVHNWTSGYTNGRWR